MKKKKTNKNKLGLTIRFNPELVNPKDARAVSRLRMAIIESLTKNFGKCIEELWWQVK